MATVEIPLSGRPEKFAVTLNDQPYVMRLVYADTADAGWLLDILDGTEQPLVCGIPMLPKQNLLDQYEYLAIGGVDGDLQLVSPGDGSDPPTFDNLSDFRLYFTEGN